MGHQFDYSLLQSSGEDIFISANVDIRRPQLVRVGHHVAIDSGLYATTQMHVGDWVHIGPYVTVIGGAQGLFSLAGFNTVGAGSRILCGSDQFLGEGLVGMSPPEYRDVVNIAPVTLELFASLGTNVVVHPGVRIAQGCVIGSCSLVTKDTQPWTIYMGTPARPVRPRRKDKMIAYARAMGYEVPDV